MLNKLRLLGIGKSFFLAGIFLLASAPFISSIFFFIELSSKFLYWIAQNMQRQMELSSCTDSFNNGNNSLYS